MYTDAYHLPGFLLARIAEDEAAAISVDDHGDVAGYSVEPFDEAPLLTVRPGRVLAECATKRRIVAAYTEMSRWAPNPRDTEARPFFEGMELALRDVLRQIAAPYADHPDYKAWRT